MGSIFSKRLSIGANDPLTINGKSYLYEPNLSPAVLAADPNNTNTLPGPDGIGGLVEVGKRPADVMLGMGQSNMAGAYLGGDTPIDSRVLSWNARWNSPGTALEIGEQGKGAFPKNNIALQAARFIAQAKNSAQMVVNIARGSTPMEHFLPGATSPDMFAIAQREMTAAFAAMGVAPYPIKRFIWIQGGSNEGLKSLSLEKRANASDPLISWAGGFLELYARLLEQPWFDENTEIVLGEGGFGAIDSFNSGIAMLIRSGLIPNLLTVNNRYAELEPGDNFHFSGQGLTDIGRAVATAFLSPSTSWRPNVIDQPMTYPLGQTAKEIEDNYGLFSRFEYLDDGSVSLLHDGVTLDRAVTIRGIPDDISSRIIIEGNLTGTQAGALASDFVGGDVEPDRTIREMADIPMMESFYTGTIDTGSNRGFDFDDATLVMKNTILKNNGTSPRDLIDLKNGAKFGYHGVTLVGSNGTNSVAIDAEDAEIYPLVTETVSTQASPLCIAYGRGSSTFNKGGAIGAKNCVVDIPRATICEIELKAIIASGRTTVDAHDAVFQDIGQNPMDMQDLTSVIDDNATFTRFAGEAVKLAPDARRTAD